MDEALKKFTEEIAAEIATRFKAPEAKAVIEATQKAAESDTGTFEVVITTENIDRYQEIIKLDGWDTANYMKNPVVLWGHDSRSIPIGITTNIEVRDGKMIARGKFAPASANPFAQQIRALYDLGMMRATSVGFIEKEREGNIITKAELLEFSFVSIPANPYALSTMVKSGVSVNEMVTKGIVIVKEEAPENGGAEPEKPGAEPLANPNEQEPVTPAEPEIEPVTPSEAKALAPIVAQLKDVLIALEAAVQTDEPEREEAAEEDEDETVDTEEQRKLNEFSEKRRILQQAATIVGEVLAEARQAVEVRK